MSQFFLELRLPLSVGYALSRMSLVDHRLRRPRPRSARSVSSADGPASWTLRSMLCLMWQMMLAPAPELSVHVLTRRPSGSV